MPWRQRHLGHRIREVVMPADDDVIHKNDREEIVNAIWGYPGTPNPLQQRPNRSALSDRDYDFLAFFRFFKKTCENLNPTKHVVVTYGDLVDLILQLKGLRGLSREDIIAAVRGNYGNAAANDLADPESTVRIFNSIDVALQMLLMFSVGDQPRPGVRAPSLQWNPGETLNALLVRAFPQFDDYDGPPNPAISGGTANEGNIVINGNPNIRIGNRINNVEFHAGTSTVPSTADRMFADSFNFRDMHYLAGFEICPTTDLRDHLLLIKYPDRTFRSRVFVFYHASVLKELLYGDFPLEPGFAEETLRTLGLLIPDFYSCQTWFSWQYSWPVWERLLSFSYPEIDRQAGRQYFHASFRRVSEFNYWRNRLLLLEEEFDKSERATIRSYFIDRRKPRDWAIGMATIFAFVIAIVALFVTILATVYGRRSVQEAQVANAIASNASTSAIAAAANTNTSSPVTIVVCCSSTSNSSVASNSLGIQTPIAASNITTEPVVTVTVLTLTTATVSATLQITTTINLGLSTSS